MTMIQRVAQIFGVVFLLVAVIGFVASGTSMEADPAMAPKALGLFPVNLVHNLVHAAFGVWGLVASHSFGGAKSYATVGGIIYLVLAGLGFVAPDGFGLVPLGGHDIWLHVILGAALLAAGATAKDVPRRDTIGA
jgi:hypothetical protein